MRLLPALLLFAAVASAAETATLDHAKYTEALKAFRQGKASALRADPTIIPVPGPPFQPLPFLAIQQQPDPGAADEEVINQEQ